MLEPSDSYAKLQVEYAHMIRLAKKLRDDGRVTGPLSVFVVAYPMKSLAEARINHSSDPAVIQLRDKMRSLEESADPMEEETTGPKDGHEELAEIKRAFENLREEYIAETFREFGESQLLTFYRHHRVRFDTLYDMGRNEIYGDGESQS